MATFVLVHGAWHGSWCWDRLVPELEAAGHRAITLDLPSASERLGAEVTELPGSHSPFWSRPEAVSRVLNDVAG